MTDTIRDLLHDIERVLVEFHACSDPDCEEPNCLHVLPRVRSALSSPAGTEERYRLALEKIERSTCDANIGIIAREALHPAAPQSPSPKAAPIDPMDVEFAKMGTLKPAPLDPEEIAARAALGEEGKHA